jgi:hypothetical protein
VIANSGTNELRFYDGDGTYLFMRGGEGGGPGEFRSMGEIWTLGDSLFIYDFGQMRMTVCSTAGEFGRTFRVREAPDGGFPFPEGVLAPHSLLVRRTPRDSELSAGFNRDTSLYLRYSLEGEPLDSLGWFPGDESYMGFREDFTYGTSAPFGLRAYMLAAGDLLYYGSSDAYEIELRTSDGTLQRLIRRPVPNAPVTAEEVEEFHRSYEDREEDSNIWVAEYSEERDDEGTWSVFDSEGRFLGTVETPTGGRVQQIGGDFVLGVWRDELDVEYVRLYSSLPIAGPKSTRHSRSKTNASPGFAAAKTTASIPHSAIAAATSPNRCSRRFGSSRPTARGRNRSRKYRKSVSSSCSENAMGRNAISIRSVCWARNSRSCLKRSRFSARKPA